MVVGAVVDDVFVAVTAASVILKHALFQPIVAPRFIHNKKDMESFRLAPRLSTVQSYESNPEAGMVETVRRHRLAWPQYTWDGFRLPTAYRA